MGWIGEHRPHGVDGVAGEHIGSQRHLFDPQRMIGRPVPDPIAANLEVRVGPGWRGNVGADGRRPRHRHCELLPLAHVAIGVVDHVVVDEDIAIGDRLVAPDDRSAPAALGKIGSAGRLIPITRP